MVSKKTILILIVASTVAVISAMFVTGSFRSEFDKRLEEISQISFILPVEFTVETHKERAGRECAELKLSAIYFNRPEHWNYGWWSARSWSEFKEMLLNAMADGEFKGGYVFFHKGSRTIWFDTLHLGLVSSTNALGTTYLDGYSWNTIYIIIN